MTTESTQTTGKPAQANRAYVTLAGFEALMEWREERKKLRKSRRFWIIVAILALIAAVLAFSGLSGAVHGPHIARHSVTGMIFSDSGRDRVLQDIENSDSVQALILDIDSPGGTVVGSEALYDSIRRIAEKKPVVAVMGEAAASGGYITALAADHLVARGNTITGSIGVIFQSPNAHELMEKIGVEMVEIRSAPLKAQPSPFKPVDPAVIVAEEALVEDSFNWFKGLVEERRGLSGNALGAVTDGRIFTGRMAKDAGLVDAIGGEQAARDWLGSEHGLDADMMVLDYEIPRENQGAADLLFGVLGLSPRVQRTLAGPALMAYSP